jgi:hypothetical protein
MCTPLENRFPHSFWYPWNSPHSQKCGATHCQPRHYNGSLISFTSRAFISGREGPTPHYHLLWRTYGLLSLPWIEPCIVWLTAQSLYPLRYPSFRADEKCIQNCRRRTWKNKTIKYKMYILCWRYFKKELHDRGYEYESTNWIYLAEGRFFLTPVMNVHVSSRWELSSVCESAPLSQNGYSQQWR